MSRMTFDQRLVAPVRMTAMDMWRNVDDGPPRVAPTLQPMRPLRGGPDPAVRVSLDPQIAELLATLDAGFPAGAHHDRRRGQRDDPLPVRAEPEPRTRRAR